MGVQRTWEADGRSGTAAKLDGVETSQTRRRHIIIIHLQRVLHQGPEVRQRIIRGYLRRRAEIRLDSGLAAQRPPEQTVHRTNRHRHTNDPTTLSTRRDHQPEQEHEARERRQEADGTRDAATRRKEFCYSR